MPNKINFSSFDGTEWKVLAINMINSNKAITTIYFKTVINGKIEEDKITTDNDLCHLIKEDNKWRIFGNQKLYKIYSFTDKSYNNYFTDVFIIDPKKKITSVSMVLVL